MRLFLEFAPCFEMGRFHFMFLSPGFSEPMFLRTVNQSEIVVKEFQISWIIALLVG